MRKERYGTRLLSDTLVHYFWRAGQALDQQQQLVGQPSPASASPPPSATATPVNTATATSYLMPEAVLHVGAQRQYKYRCYGVNMSQYLEQVGSTWAVRGQYMTV